MGTPIPVPDPPTPVPPGELCENCWGPGKEFGDIPTPSSLTCIIDGVVKGPLWVPADGEPPNDTYELPQDPEQFACIFEILGAINLSVQFSRTTTQVEGSITGRFGFFQGQSNAECVTVVRSIINQHFTGGTATIILPPTG